MVKKTLIAFTMLAIFADGGRAVALPCPEGADCTRDPPPRQRPADAPGASCMVAGRTGSATQGPSLLLIMATVFALLRRRHTG